MYYLTRIKHDCSSAQYIFNWNMSLTGHKGRLAFTSANNAKVNCKRLRHYQYVHSTRLGQLNSKF